MAFQYNGNTKLITTDDIITTGSVQELGENLSTILEQQSNDIAQLKSNVKWITKHGGVGGGTGGSGGGGAATATKFTVQIDYTDNNEIDNQILINQKNTTINPILSQTSKQVRLKVTITSAMSTNISYSYSFDSGNSKSQGKFENTRELSFSFITELVQHNCVLTIYGETTTIINFKVFTQIINNLSSLYSNDIKLSNDSTIDPSRKEDGLQFKTEIVNLLPDLFDASLTKVTLNETNTLQLTGLNESVEVSDYFETYGLYTFLVEYQAVNKITGDIYNFSQQYVYIYKESNRVYIYCYTDSKDFIVYNKSTQGAIDTNIRSLPLIFRVYGLFEDNSNTTYNVNISVNGNEPITYKTPCRIFQNYTYSLLNEVTTQESSEVSITFSTITSTSISSSTYYVYLKKPAELAYIFKTGSGLNKCYGAKGDNTDAVALNGSVLFPDPSHSPTHGDKYYSFEENDTKNKLVINEIPSGVLKPTLASGQFCSISTFVSQENLVHSDGSLLDGIVSIGIHYQDTSYDKTVFVLNDSSGHQISFYRNKIVNDSSVIERFGMPDDEKFHLITIYFKQNYEITDTTKWSQSNYSFAVYIDGVLDVRPTDTDFAFGIRSYCTFSPGLSEYNFFGAEIFNPVPTQLNTSDFQNIYRGVIKKYVQDYDPIIISNYYMCYATLHKADLGYEPTQQPFSDNQLQIDYSIYSDFGSGSSYVNCYNIKLNNEEFHYNKFIPISINSFVNKFIAQNSTIPIYRIVPVFTTGNVENGLHKFISGTMRSFGENEPLTEYDCDFQRFDGSSWRNILPEYTDSRGVTHTVRFKIKYQGSSTLLYSVKNFLIKTISAQDPNDTGIVYNYYFNPDSSAFKYPETNFNLKADLVDSSSCTNNVIGNFVNKYMKSPFSSDPGEFKSCLSGRPILLFVNNNITNDTSVVTDDLFLGIYNLNLNRGSVNNLGYQRVENVENLQGNFNDTYWQIVTKDNIKVTNGLVVAEMQGNGNVYDFSQFDHGLLNQIFGDFYTVTSTGDVVEEYNSAIQLLCRDFSAYVRNSIIRQGVNDTFPVTDYGIESLTESENIYNNISSNVSFLGYYELTPSGAAFKRFTTRFNDPNDSLTPDNIIIVSRETMETKKISYRTISNNGDTLDGLSILGNSDYQFHLIYNDNSGKPYIYNNTTYCYFVENISENNNYDPDVNRQIFDLDSSIKYYMVCMAFAMVDSVQKNLNIKRPNNDRVWYPQFYDMDTALGIDNAGNTSNYKAFSDFVTRDGRVISDYVEQGTSGWFDTPSSYLFLYAKYEAILNQVGGDNEKRTPLQYWLSLRGVQNDVPDVQCAGALRDADTFCNQYLNSYITNDISPIVWNLNYLYKYFSETFNNTKDTEASRFNGRMIYRRRTWLEQRLHYLDALFGISNRRTIGTSGHSISNAETPQGNDDIEICGTMFEGFKKGISSAEINDILVKDQPRTPIILQTSDSSFTLYMTDDDGEAIINNSITSNTSIAFNGTKHLLYIENCSPFLQNDDLGSNTIKGDQIEEIVVQQIRGNNNNNKIIKSVIIDLEDLPAVKKIIIGNQSSDDEVDRCIIGSIQINGRGKNIIIQINNVEISEQNIQITDCNINYYYDTGTSSFVDGFSPNSSRFQNIYGNKKLSFTNCNITGDRISRINKISDIPIIDLYCNAIELNGCNIKGNLIIKNVYNPGSTLTTNNISFTESSYYFRVEDQYLKTINISNSTIYNFSHGESTNLSSCVIKLNSQNSVCWVTLNSDIAQNSSAPYYQKNSTSNNKKLTKLTVEAENAKYVTLRLPLFPSLTQLELKGKFRIGSYGLANSGLLKVIIDPTQQSGIVGLSTSIVDASNYTGRAAIGAFLGFEGDFRKIVKNEQQIDEELPLSAEDWENVFQLTTQTSTGETIKTPVNSLRYCFANRRTNGLPVSDVKNILRALKNIYFPNSIFGLFHATNIITDEGDKLWSELSDSYRKQLLIEIEDSYPTLAASSGTAVFWHTNFDVLTKGLASKIQSKSFQNFLGTSKIYIESGALNSFKTITNGVISSTYWNTTGSTSVNSFYPEVYISNIDEDSGEITNTEEIKYGEEFSFAEALRLNIYTSSTVSFDYGQEGMGPKIVSYYGLFDIGTHYGNVLNIQNMFNNTRALTTVQYDFHNFTLSLDDVVRDNRVVKLYNYLVNSNGKINSKAYSILTSRASLTSAPSDYPFQGSFYKKITSQEFKDLIELLVVGGYQNISCIFQNCTITDIDEDPAVFFYYAFYNKLGKFKQFYCAFRNSRFRTTNNKEVPIILDSRSQILNEDDEETENIINPLASEILGNAFQLSYFDEDKGITENVDTTIPVITGRAFEGCYIKSFKGKIGISDNKITNGYRMFAECTFQYDNSEEQYYTQKAGNLVAFQVPKVSKPLLPIGFLDFCKIGTENAAREMFCYDSASFSGDHLTGCFPSEPNFGDSRIQLVDTFQNCNVYYHKHSEVESNGTTTTNWVIFPGWYTTQAKSKKAVDSSGNATGGIYNVFIPVPIYTQEENKIFVCSLFGRASEIGGGNYGLLPKLPPRTDGVSTYSPVVVFSYYSSNSFIYLTLDTHELPLIGSYFKKIFPIRLSPIIRLDGISSTVITNVTKNKQSSYKPINVHDTGDGLARENIFGGILTTGSSSEVNNLEKVITL